MVKRGFGVGTLETSFEEGLEEAIEISRMNEGRSKKFADCRKCWWVSSTAKH